MMEALFVNLRASSHLGFLWFVDVLPDHADVNFAALAAPYRTSFQPDWCFGCGPRFLGVPAGEG